MDASPVDQIPTNSHQPGLILGDHPAPNELPPAYPSILTLVLSAAHPQLLILYSYFLLIGFLLYRVLTRSILSGVQDRWDHVKDARRKEVVLWSVLALVSLGSTWTYMIKYFIRSYSDWFEKANLSSYGIPALPVCPARFGLSGCHISLAATYFQRFSQWLSNTSLFTEAWLLVVSNEANWWWSLEVCLYTVGPWTVFLHTQRRRTAVPHLWLYMLIGQTVAISFAACLYQIALALRPFPDGTLVQSAALRNASKDYHNVSGQVEKYEVDEYDNEGNEFTRARSIYRLLLEPPSTHPSLASRLLLFGLTILAALSIYNRPTTIGAVLFIHLLPVSLTLPHRWLHRVEEHVQERILNPSPDSDDEAGVHASNARIKTFLRPSHLLGFLTLWNLLLKVQTTLTLLTKINSSVYLVDRFNYGSLRLLIHTLYPTTFHSHEAQSSISSDTVCLTLITIVFIGTDAARIWQQGKQLFARHKSVHLRPVLSRKRVPLTAGLLALSTPILGPSVTYSAWLAIRENILETAESSDEAWYRRRVGEDVGLVVKQIEDEIISVVNQVKKQQ
ncbi:unnamed protein product [Sympodiomycopsis kandeliae]